MKKILIIEDDESLGKTLLGKIQEVGHEATQAVDAYQGQQAITNLKPDLIILDLMLPAGNGVDVLRNLRSSFQTQATPVIIMTAFQDSTVREEMEKIGIARYFTKPFSQDEMIEEIKNILG